MATTTPSAALVPVAPVFTNTERLALAGFLAGYSGLTRQAYELDLRPRHGMCTGEGTRAADLSDYPLLNDHLLRSSDQVSLRVDVG
jgi:hypothetical protein